MAVLKRDYYEVLGVPKDADDETIRRAFQAQAREWHPDVAGTPDAEARFRELAEAYTVLSKRESRLLYDRHGFRGRGNPGLDEALWGVGGAATVRGENIQAHLELRSFEAEQGTRRVISFHALTPCPACVDGDVDPGCGFCQGAGTVETERRIRLRIPPGVEDGAQLRVIHDGSNPGSHPVPGDLLVRVRVLPPTKDPRSVRYIAFALLLVAIAALVVYAVR
jgi:curved DNA-binding protein